MTQMPSKQEYNKNYYLQNKKRILEMVSKKITCDKCQRVINYQNRLKHEKSTYCKNHTKKDTVTCFEQYIARIEQLERYIQADTALMKDAGLYPQSLLDPESDSDSDISCSSSDN